MNKKYLKIAALALLSGSVLVGSSKVEATPTKKDSQASGGQSDNPHGLTRGAGENNVIPSQVSNPTVASLVSQNEILDTQRNLTNEESEESEEEDDSGIDYKALSARLDAYKALSARLDASNGAKKSHLLVETEDEEINDETSMSAQLDLLNNQLGAANEKNHALYTKAQLLEADLRKLQSKYFDLKKKSEFFAEAKEKIDELINENTELKAKNEKYKLKIQKLQSMTAEVPVSEKTVKKSAAPPKSETETVFPALEKKQKEKESAQKNPSSLKKTASQSMKPQTSQSAQATNLTSESEDEVSVVDQKKNPSKTNFAALAKQQKAKESAQKNRSSLKPSQATNFVVTSESEDEVSVVDQKNPSSLNDMKKKQPSKRW